jgi:hypothetical protein
MLKLQKKPLLELRPPQKLLKVLQKALLPMPLAPKLMQKLHKPPLRALVI